MIALLKKKSKIIFNDKYVEPYKFMSNSVSVSRENFRAKLKEFEKINTDIST